MCIIDCAVEGVDTPCGFGGYQVFPSGGRCFCISLFADESEGMAKLVAWPHLTELECKGYELMRGIFGGDSLMYESLH